MSADIARELAEVKVKIVDTEKEIAVVKSAGHSEANVAYLTELTGTLKQLYIEKNRLAAVLTGVGLGGRLHEFDFSRSFLRRSDFPPSDGGAVIFKREQLVQKMVDAFVTKDIDDNMFSSFYFRASAGTGKTVLLKLFGQELQRRGFIVYMLTAPELDTFDKDYFKNLFEALHKVDEPTAILVDEVHRNVNSLHWDYLLKKAPRNLLVIGTGIPDLLFNDSPQFLKKYPSEGKPAIGPLTEVDMPEVLEYFIPKRDTQEEQEKKKEALQQLLIATGGQGYAFVIIAKHLLKPENINRLTNLSAYLTSEAFYTSKDYSKVRERCYAMMDRSKVDILARFLLEKPLEPNDRENAMKSCLWTGDGFVSPLFVQELFQKQLIIPSMETKLDLSDEPSSPVVEQIIAAGLGLMNPIDFQESNFSTMDNNERGLAFRWGVNCGSTLKHQVFVTSEVVTVEKTGESGSKPTIDFVVNGKLNLGFELAKDRPKTEMLDKLQKIGEKGVYSRHNSYILHFVFKKTYEKTVEQINGFPLMKQSRVYTFMPQLNMLLCGTKIVRKGVVRNLPSPPSMFPITSKNFSTMAFGALKRLGRLV